MLKEEVCVYGWGEGMHYKKIVCTFIVHTLSAHTCRSTSMCSPTATIFGTTLVVDG